MNVLRQGNTGKTVEIGDQSKMATRENSNKYSSIFSNFDDISTSTNAKLGATTPEQTKCCCDHFSYQPADRRMQTIKMCILILIPCIGLIISIANGLMADITERNEAIQIYREIKYNGQLAKLIEALQMERGKTVLWISTNRNDTVLQDVRNARTSTDKLTNVIEHKLTSYDEVAYLLNAAAFKNYLRQHRRLAEVKTTVYDELEFYSEINNILINWISSGVRKKITGQLWHDLIAYQQLWRAREELGLARALGSAYFSQRQLSHRELLRYNSKIELGKTSIDLAQLYSHTVNTSYSKMVNETIMYEFGILHQRIYNNTDHQPSLSQANYWFNLLTDYMTVILRIQQKAENNIESQSIQISSQAGTNFIVSLVLLICVTVIGPILLYATTKLTQSIQTYATRLMKKTQQLAKETKMRENLLSEILPKSIIQQVKLGNKVAAETYTNVTVYVSNIVAFGQICRHTDAIGVIQMLNNLYAAFDSQITKHDVYKVETISDTYMVVSGVPNELPAEKQAIKIANMALTLLHTVKNLKAPHNPACKLQLRAGINSGSCAAGIVGTNMPRYCLFGEAVTVASRMATAGEPSRIHCSATTYQILASTGRYQMLSRGNINIKGYGEVRTYWLVEKKRN